eukprot:2528811-Karenia_brevis.AAC.1
MAQLSKCSLTGVFSDWPLDQATACEVCRVHFLRGQESVVDKYAELRTRSQVVKEMANIHIERHMQDLGKRINGLELKASNQHACLADRFREHIERRVDAEYPAKEFGTTRSWPRADSILGQKVSRGPQ